MLLAILAALAAARPAARAEPPPRPATEKAARAHLAAADRAFRRGDHDEALAHLQAAYAIDPRPEYLIAFAQVYRAMGDPQRAVDACQRYLSTAPDGPRAAEARGLAAVARSELARNTAETAETSTPPAPAANPRPAASGVPLAASPVVAPPAAASAPAAPRRKRHLAIWLGVGAAGVTVVGLAVGLGLGLGLRSPPKISFDP